MNLDGCSHDFAISEAGIKELFVANTTFSFNFFDIFSNISNFISSLSTTASVTNYFLLIVSSILSEE